MHLIAFPSVSNSFEPIFSFVPPVCAARNKINRDVVSRPALDSDLEICRIHSCAPCFHHCFECSVRSLLSNAPFTRRQALQDNIGVTVAESPKQRFHGRLRCGVTSIRELIFRPDLILGGVSVTNDNRCCSPDTRYHNNAGHCCFSF